MKCTKKRDASAELLFCLFNQLLFWRSRCRRRRGILKSLVSCSALFKAFLNLTECKQRIWFRESGKFLPVESGILGFRIHNTAQKPGIALNRTWNLESKFHWQSLESGVRDVESRIQDCLGFLYMERSTLLKRKDGPLPLRNIRLESQTRRAICVSLTEMNAMAKRKRQWESVYSHVLIKLYFLHPRNCPLIAVDYFPVSCGN